MLGLNFSYSEECNCPTTTGWQQVTISVPFKYGEIMCRTDITYCYFCGDNSLHREIYFCKADLYPYTTPDDPCVWPDSLDIGGQNFWDLIYLNIMTDMADNCPILYPPCSDFSPEAALRRVTEIKHSSCMKSTFNFVKMCNEIRPCETEAVCVIEFDVCMGIELAKSFRKVGSYEIGNSGCPRKVVGLPGLNYHPTANYEPGTCFNPCY